MSFFFVFFFKQKTAYEMRISDWSSDVCSSDLREVPCEEVLKQPLIRAQSTAGEPWRAVAQRVLGDALQDREQLVSSFDIAMTLVSAGYGIVVAPSARLAGYLNRSIAARPLAGAPTVVMAYLLHPRDRKSTRLTSSH